MHGIKALIFFVPFEQREIDNPEALEFVFVAQTKLISHLQTQFAELLACLVYLVSAEDQQQITRLSAESRFNTALYPSKWSITTR